MKTLKYTKYVYLIVAVLSIYKVYDLWNAGSQAYIFMAFAALSLFMFFFRNYYEKKFDKRKNQD